MAIKSVCANNSLPRETFQSHQVLSSVKREHDTMKYHEARYTRTWHHLNENIQYTWPGTFYFHQIWSKTHRSYYCTLAIPTGRAACHCETEKYLSRPPAKENFVPFIFIKSGQERVEIRHSCRRFSDKLKGNYTRRFLSGPTHLSFSWNRAKNA